MRIISPTFFIQLSDKFTALDGKENDFPPEGVWKLTRR